MTLVKKKRQNGKRKKKTITILTILGKCQTKSLEEMNIPSYVILKFWTTNLIFKVQIQSFAI